MSTFFSRGFSGRRRIPPEQFVRIGRRAGLKPVARHEFLKYQYFVVLARPRPR